MNATELELYGMDLMLELERPSSALVSQAGVVREVGPAHAGQPDPITIGDRVIVLSQLIKHVCIDGKKCALVGADALLWRFTKRARADF
jgi:hypothetical protein